MNTSGVERYLSFINAQLRANGKPRNGEGQNIRAITISRQAGCDAHAIAEKLANCLAAAGPKGAAPWMVMDRELVEMVLHDHKHARPACEFHAGRSNLGN